MSYTIDDRIYGKADVRVVHVKRKSRYDHVVHDLRVNVLLKLTSDIDYTLGDNKDIVATDTTKNTVYVLAKKCGVETPEQFALNIVNHYFTQYKHVEYMDVDIEANIWKRVLDKGRPHGHAFVRSGEGIHTCRVTQKRGQPPVLLSGIKGLEIMKTTQSGFEGYIKDQFTTLKESNDRIFRTVVSCQSEFSTVANVNFEKAHEIMKNAILTEFAGPADTGVYSPSVQNTIYLVEKNILNNIPQVSRVSIEMPNRHCIPFDLTPFHLKNENEVYISTSEPAGLIRASLSRAPSSKL